jgi:hypothetical protein
MPGHPLLRATGLGLVATYAVLQVRGRRSGSTRAERTVALPGDELVPRPQLVTDHAATIPAPPAEVWPWLTQMGWHRAGWYTPRWVDRLLFPANRPSLDRLDPALVRDLRIGDRIPDGPPGTAEYVVARVEPPGLLVLRSTSHLPPGWSARGASIDWTWTFRLAPRDGGRTTRLHLRVRGRMSPWWLRLAYLAVIVPAEAVMASGMLRGIGRRVAQAGTEPPPAA